MTKKKAFSPEPKVTLETEKTPIVKPESDISDIAYKLLTLGYSVIPSGGSDTGKAPLVDWKPFQEVAPTEEQFQDFCKLKPLLWGIVTGKVSGVVVLDSDTPESAAIVKKAGLKRHIKTPNGQHIWHTHPGKEIKNAVRKVNGLDWRGDGGFVNVIGTNPVTGKKYVIEVLPTPDTIYSWDKLPPEVAKVINSNGTKPKAPTKAPKTVIFEGQGRNAACTREAGRLSHIYKDVVIVKEMTLAYNNAVCKPPLTLKELEDTVFKSIPKWVAEAISKISVIPTNGAIRNTLTDSGNNDRLVDLFGKLSRYNYERNLWLHYDGKRWRWDDGGEIIRIGKNTARHIYHEAAEQPDDTKRDELVKHAKASESNMHIRAMIDLSRAELAITVAELDANHWLLNANNGTIDLRTGELLPHNPDDFITNLIPIDYIPGKRSDLWDSFLDRIFESKQGLIEFVQKAAGYSMTGSQDEQCFYFLHGFGANGKTTFIGAITDVAGDYAGEIDPVAFMVDKYAKAGPNESLASLLGKRFVSSTEVSGNMPLNVALVKRMTGGEMIRCERKHEHGHNFKPTHKLWLSGNHEPRIADTTNSIWNRLKYIPFNVTIGESERVKGLRHTLSRDHGEAILAWLVEGCLKWQSDGLGEPLEVKTAIEAYRENQDILHDFLQERCLINKSDAIEQKLLFADYKKWAEENDVTAIGKLNFRTRLNEKGIGTGTGNRNVKTYKGIRLLLDCETPESVTLVTLVTANQESSQEDTRVIKTSLKNGNKSNKSNTINKSNTVFECPKCKKEDAEYSEDMTEMVCPCGERWPIQ